MQDNHFTASHVGDHGDQMDWTKWSSGSLSATGTAGSSFQGVGGNILKNIMCSKM